MARTRANGIDIEYEWYGDPADPVVVGVVGLSDQLICWPRALVDAVTEAGFSFLAFDSRDMGHSTHFDTVPTPDVRAVLVEGQPFEPPYTLADMARDTTGLLEALEIERAHILGYSMGGAVAQLALAERPRVFSSLTSIFSTSYAPGLPGRDADVSKRMLACCEPGLSAQEWVRRMDHLFERVNGRRYRLGGDGDATPARLAERRFDAGGMARHVLAIYAHRTNPPLDLPRKSTYPC